MKKTEIICKYCGKSFLINDCYIKRDGKRLYCSRNCYTKSRTPETHFNYNKDEGWMECKGCGIKFKVKPFAKKNGKGKTYCTPECRNNTIGKIEIKCAECGKIKLVFRSQKKEVNFCSRSCASINYYRKNNQMNKGIQRGNGGKRIDLNNQYFRSSWEANYARYLNFLIQQKEIAKWEYEVDTFEFKNIKRGVRFYTPDFKVYDNKGEFIYHEVKGYMDSKSITRHKRMDKYYPEIKIKMIDKTWFRKNGTTLSKIIKNWELFGATNKRLY